MNQNYRDQFYAQSHVKIMRLFHMECLKKRHLDHDHVSRLLRFDHSHPGYLNLAQDLGNLNSLHIESISAINDLHDSVRKVSRKAFI